MAHRPTGAGPAGPPSGLDLVAPVAALLLLVAYSTTVLAAFWSPRAAVALVVVAFGLPVLLALTLRNGAGAGPAARCGLGFLAWAALATALAAHPVLALLGRYNQGTGLLFVAALVSAWAIGVATTGAGRRRLEQALLVGALVNCAVGLLQAAFDLSSFHLGVQGGRSAGLVANPVHLGAVAAGAIALLLPRLDRRPWPWSPAVVAAVAAVQVSGTRSALLVVAALVVFQLVRRGWCAGLVLALLVVLGIAAGAATSAVGPGDTAAGSAARSADGSAGLAARTGIWTAALHSVVDHPVVGVGPGRFEEATSGRRTLALARAEGSGREFTDGHDLLVEYATTVGLPGVVLLLAWLVVAGRRSRGPLALFAASIALVGLLEPQSVATTVVAALALGGAWTGSRPVRGGEGVDVGGAARATAAALMIVALAASAMLLLGDHHLADAAADQSVADGIRARSLLPPWPDPDTRLAAAHSYRAIVDGRAVDTDLAIAAYRRAAARDPADPILWNQLAGAELGADHFQAAETAYRRSLTRDPWFATALNGLARSLIGQGRPLEARGPFERSLQVVPDQPAVRTQLASLPR